MILPEPVQTALEFLADVSGPIAIALFAGLAASVLVSMTIEAFK